MRIGFNLPNSGPLAAPDIMTRWAQAGEAIGYDYLTLTDHVVLPDRPAPGYPYSESGEFYGDDPMSRHELLAAAAFIAARTSRIRIATAVLVVPHRPAVLAAKTLATIDVLSGGRLIVGVGAGWLEAEFEAVVTTPFRERGAVTDEYIRAFRELWTKDKPQFEGTYARFAGIVMRPKPVQTPHPPIWVGGESAPSMRRAAALGDAWYPIGSNQKHLLDTRKRLEAGIARLRRLTAEARRPPEAVEVVVRIKRYGAAVPALANDGDRRLFSGGDADIAADLRAIAGLGVTAVDVDFEQADPDAAIAEMRRFHADVYGRI